MTKDELRRRTLEALHGMSKDKRQGEADVLFKGLLIYLDKHPCQRLAFYYGFEPEVDTATMMDHLLQEGIEIYLPRIQANRQMTFHRYLGREDLEVVQQRIYQPRQEALQIEPEDIDLVIVPGLLWNSQGFRIGFGGGYYDRFLAKYSLPTLSLLFSCQFDGEGLWPVDSFDRAVDHLLIASDQEVIIHESIV